MSTLDPTQWIPSSQPRAATAHPAVMLALGVSALVLALVSLGPQPDGPDVESASAEQIRAFLAGDGTDLR